MNQDYATNVNDRDGAISAVTDWLVRAQGLSVQHAAGVGEFLDGQPLWLEELAVITFTDGRVHCALFNDPIEAIAQTLEKVSYFNHPSHPARVTGTCFVSLHEQIDRLLFGGV